MLAISFLFAGVLGALAALAVPVLLHLLMRSRPKRMALPTVSFLRESFQQNRFRLRVSRWLLLAVRMALLAAVVVLIAWPMLPAAPARPASRAPIALAIVVDTSASMGAMRGKQSVSRIGRDQAARIVRDVPAGSRVAVLRSDEPFGREGLLAGTDGPVRLLEQASPGYRDTPLDAAIGQGRGLLAGAELDEKVLLVITDMTAQAWQASGTRDAAVPLVVLDCGSAGLSNAGLFLQGRASLTLGPGESLRLPLVARSTSGSAELAIAAWIDDQAVLSRSVSLRGGDMAESFDLGPQRPGMRRVRAALDVDDAFSADNQRYIACSVASPPRVVLVASPAGPTDRTAFILASVIAPPSPEGGDLARLRQIAPAQLTAEGLARADILVLGSAGGLDEPQWQAVEAFVRRGGGLWVVPGPMTAAAGYAGAAARRVLPAGVQGQRSLETAVGLVRSDATTALLGELARPGGVSFDEVGLLRRLAVEPASPSASVELRCEDGQAVLLRADEPGFYELDFDDGTEGVLAANVPADESDLTRLSPAELRQLLGRDDLAVIRTADEFSPAGTVRGRIDLLPAVLVALVVLSIFETLLARRSAG
jgi:hypothetical protein